MTPRRVRVEPNVWKRQDRAGRWVYEIAYRDSDGRQRRETVNGGLIAARRVRDDLKGRMAGGRRVAPSPRLTFEQAADQWLQAQTELRPATLATYRAHLRTHLLPRWGRRRLDNLTVDDAARLAEDLRRAGKKAWTVRGVLVVANQVFDFARRRLGWAGENPVRGLHRSERPRSDQRKRRVLSGDELAAVLAAANGHYGTAFSIAAMTGLRCGEVLGLRWRNIDLDAGTLIVEAQLDRHGHLAEPKTEHALRSLELPTALVSVLRSHKLRSAASLPDDFVLVSRTGHPLDHRTVTRAFALAVERAGIAAPAPTLHDLRHTFASRFIASGGDLVSLSVHLGHANASITASTYSHEFERAARAEERRARLDVMFGSAMAAAERNAARPETEDEAAQVLELQAIRDTA